MFATLIACLLYLSLQEPTVDRAGNSAAEQQTDEALQKQVEGLIKQLNSDSIVERNDAEKSLIALGPPILGLLKSASGEAGQRIARVRNILERQAIEKNTEGRLVSLDGEMTVTDALKELEKQSGNKLIGIEGREKKINLELKDVPFWQALDKILDEGQLTVDDYGGGGEALQIIPRVETANDRSGNVHYQGIFRIAPARLSVAKNLENPELDLFRLTLKVSWEPRLRPISLNIPLDIVKVQDDVGDDVPLSRTEGTVGASVQNVPGVELTLPVQLPSREASAVSVEGELTAVVPGRLEEFEFANLKSPKKQKIQRGEATITFEGMQRNNDLHGARIRVQFENPQNSMESHRGWIYSNQAYLVTADGVKIETINMEMFNQGENGVVFNYLFDIQEVPDGLKLIYKSPAAIVSLPVKFSLRGIELP